MFRPVFAGPALYWPGLVNGLSQVVVRNAVRKAQHRLVLSAVGSCVVAGRSGPVCGATRIGKV